MQFDNLDNKFRDAAEHHHPAYNENAWAKMEKLLDKHMPVQEKKRRFLFFFLVLVLIAGSAIIFIVQPWKTGKKQNTQTASYGAPNKSNDKNILSKTVLEPGQQVKHEIKRLDSEENAVKTTEDAQTISNIENNPVYPGKNNTNSISSTPASFNTGKASVLFESKNKKRDQLHLGQNPTQHESVKTNIVNNTDNKVVINNDKKTLEHYTEVQRKPTDNTEVSLQEAKSKPAAKTNLVTAVAEKIQPVPAQSTQTKVKKRIHDLFFTLGGGPDISFVHTKNPGTVKLFGGGGIGYTYKDKLSLRTGFYTGRKIYTADAGDYNAPPEFYTWYPYLEKVEANCKVYEIPIALSYNFAKKKQGQFFISASVSTYLMKEETYNYYYKYTPTGPTVNRERTIQQANKHFFAGMGLSAGYTRKINKRLSFSVEPYAKLPLKGIGYGKVNLSSSGVLFSLGVHPFNARNK